MEIYNMMAPIPRTLILVGTVLILCGVAFHFSDRIWGLKHLGSLPGDVKIEGKNFKFYFPWVSCIVLSILFTVIGYIIRRIPK